MKVKNPSNWISVNERLPTPYTNVLICLMASDKQDTNMVGIGYLDDENNWRYAEHFGRFTYHVSELDDEWASDFYKKWITHWQELPEPPTNNLNP